MKDPFESVTNYDDLLSAKLKIHAIKAEYKTYGREFSLADVILAARSASGLTQKQLAEKTGVSQADLSKIENGRGNPSYETLLRIAEGVGCRVKIQFVK